jgi:hypothetical protein
MFVKVGGDAYELSDVGNASKIKVVCSGLLQFG